MKSLYLEKAILAQAILGNLAGQICNKCCKRVREGIWSDKKTKTCKREINTEVTRHGVLSPKEHNFISHKQSK